MKEIDLFYENQEEPLKGCFLALRSILKVAHPAITEEWKYKLPFFYLNKKMFCYLWKEKLTEDAYVSFADGFRLHHSALESGDRKRFKIYRINPTEDIDVEELAEILEEAFALYS
jgi:hypothetical protein